MIEQTTALVAHLIAENPLFNFLFIAHVSNITITDLTVSSGNCLFIFRFTSSSFTYVDTASITGTQVTGIGLQTPRSIGFYTNIQIVAVAGRWVLRGAAASFTVSNVLISRSHFIDILHHVFSSTVSLVNATVSDSETGIASAFSSGITLEQINVFQCTCTHVAIDVSGGSLVSTQLAISGYRMTIGFGTVSESAAVTMIENNWSDLISEIAVGIEVTDGSLEIRNSQFAMCQLGLVSATSANVTIANSIFQDGGVKYELLQLYPVMGGILNCADCTNVLISSVQALRMSAKSGGAIQISSTASSLSPKVIIENSTFSECSAYSGGAVYITNTNVTISGSKFSNCTATTTGGGLYVWTSGFVQVSDSKFANNLATEGGGVKWGLEPVLFLNAMFNSNTAEYGPDIASYGVDLKLVDDFSGLELVSGNPLPHDLIFELIDLYGQVVSTATQTQVTLQPLNTSEYSGTNNLLGFRGVYNFSTASFLLTPGLNHTIVVDMLGTDPGFTVHVQLLLDWFFRNCTLGEAYQEDQCFTCPIGTYSFDPSAGNCSMCPPNAVCPGKSGFEVIEGYWRSGWNSTTIYECPIDTSCLGGSESECAEGYTGKMCTECDHNSSRVGTVLCLPCNDTAILALQFLALAVSIALIFVALVIFTITKDSRRIALLKLMITHSQLLMMLLHLKVKLPNVVLNYMIAIKYTTGLSISQLPFACISRNTSAVYITSVIAVIFPFGMAIVISLLLLVCYRKALTKAYLTTILTGVFYISTPITVEVLTSLIPSVTLDDDKSWLYVDMSQQMWTGTQTLLAYVLLIPGLTLIIFGNVGHLLLTLLTRKNLFLISGYQSSFCYWEHILHFFKCLFIFSIVISVNHQSLFQITCAFLVLVPLIILYSHFRPTDHGYLFHMTILSYLTIVISFGGAAYYINFDTSMNVFTVIYEMTVLGLHGIVLGGCLVPMCCRSKKRNATYSEDQKVMPVREIEMFSDSPVMMPPCNSVDHSLKFSGI